MTSNEIVMFPHGMIEREHSLRSAPSMTKSLPKIVREVGDSGCSVAKANVTRVVEYVGYSIVVGPLSHLSPASDYAFVAFN
jgi:hypothetical protein